MKSSGVALVAIFTALIVGSDFALAPFANVKLLDTIVFVAAFAFGFRMGAVVAVLSETIWSFVTPWGAGGAIIPFLVGGELLFAFAGYAASRVWRSPKNLPAFSAQNSFFGALLAICAFLWDFETNIATGLIAGANSITALLAYEFFGIPFMIPHELSDFVLGAALAPAIIAYFSRVYARGGFGIRAGNAGQVPDLGTRMSQPE
ncbi:MAG: hypothetical protein HY296_06205 [Thaumarchaeota archaeon]|nr:hypothetical protein [Nitrososphaerota archaeon]